MALSELGVWLETARAQVEETIELVGTAPNGSPPFTPGAKKELSLRESRELGQTSIGTENLLLGLVREGEGVGAQVLRSLVRDLFRVRERILLILSAYQGKEALGSLHSGLQPPEIRPIFHLSFPVRDLQEAIDFYTSDLGAEIGRRTETFADVRMFGAQVTIQNDPSSVSSPMPRTRHFGATLPWGIWQSVVDRFVFGGRHIVESPKISFEGEPIEQGKMMIADPSGNLIEIKAYRHPDKVLGPFVD